LLPGASVWFSPLEELAVFASYGRSFGSPQYQQLGLARSTKQLTAEIADTGEVGVKLLELKGVTASLTAFVMYFHAQIEFDETSFENVGTTLHRGFESELSFDLGEWADALDGTEIGLGYTWTRAQTIGGPFRGKVVPYVPEHSVWFDVGYATEMMGNGDRLKVAMDAWWESAQFSDRRNLVEPDPRGSMGLINPIFVAGTSLRYAMPLGKTLAGEARIGVKNLFNQQYFYRTDDRNAGMLLGRPFTFWAGLNLKWSPEGLEVKAVEE
ncbi:MAG: TonB-dependent receptor domain-containing protein, partial [Myxococcales bacterium]